MRTQYAFIATFVFCLAGCNNANQPTTNSTDNTQSPSNQLDQQQASSEATHSTDATAQGEAKYYAFSKLENLLPVGEVEVTAEFIDTAPSTEIQELQTKLGKAAAENPQWWQAFMSKQKGTQLPPFEPETGLTEEEYNKLANSMKRFSRTTKQQQLTIKNSSEGVFSLQAEGDLKMFDGIEIDPNTLQVRGAFGELTQASEVKSASTPVIEAYSGLFWTHLDQQSGRSVNFIVGVIQKTGKAFLHSLLTEMPTKPGERPKSELIVLYFDSPTPPQTSDSPVAPEEGQSFSNVN